MFPLILLLSVKTCNGNVVDSLHGLGDIVGESVSQDLVSQLNL